MHRFLSIKKLSLATVGLALTHSNLYADDNFILQPKIQQAVQPAVEAKIESTGPAWLPSSKERADSAGPIVSTVISLDDSANPNVTKLAEPGLDLRPAEQDSKQPMNSGSGNKTPELAWVKRAAPTGKASAPAGLAQRSLVLSQEMSVVVQPKVESPQASSLVASVGPNNALPAASVTSQLTPPSIHATFSQQSEPELQGGTTNTKRLRLASQVSQQNIGPREFKRSLARPGRALLGPAAVEQQLTENLKRAEALCSRGAFRSARAEADVALVQLARYLDSISNSFHSEPALRSAQTALKESADFISPHSEKLWREVVQVHETPVLKGVDLSRAPPVNLAQAYYQYAEDLLRDGSEQHPWFSDIFYMLGRTLQAEADTISGADANRLRTEAVVYYRAAALLRPNNSFATNQLGYVLLQLDRPAEAQAALVASVDARLEIPALQNLAEASRRIGDKRMQDWAVRTASHKKSQLPLYEAPAVIELDNAAFANTTPVVPHLNSPAAQTASQPTAMLR
jgi:tetratricopeptide (TPR) repeat protein